jgi:tetratricopeptide (TPR) repeat protein
VNTRLPHLLPQPTIVTIGEEKSSDQSIGGVVVAAVVRGDGLDGPSAAQEADEALRLVEVKPLAARELALVARARARAHDDRAALSVAEEALGLAARKLHDIGVALRHLHAAVRVAERSHLDIRAAKARVSLVAALAYRGDSAAALQQAERAAALLTGHDAARLHMQRGLVLQRLGRLDQARQSYRHALAVFRRIGDVRWEARLLNNRGILYAYQGAFRLAEADLRRAERLHLAVGEEFAATQVRSNLGFVAGRRGDVPAALAWFDLADEYFRSQGMLDAVGLLDRCEVLLSVRLISEARQAAERAVAALASGRMVTDLAEARLMLSQAALLDGDPLTARTEAERARRAFTAQGRPAWAALGSYAGLRAAWAGGERSTRTLGAARRAASALAGAGWVVPALDAHVIAGRIALELGRLDSARDELGQTSRARHHGPVELRAYAWHAEALLRLAAGDRHGADRALRAGMGVLDRYRASLGATDLRAHVSGHAGDLAALGLQLAFEDGRPDRVLAWAERWRASSLRLRPVRPPEDPVLEANMAELRQVAGQVRDAALTGQPSTRLLHRQAALEEAVRRRSRHARGPTAAGPGAPPSARSIGSALGDRVLLELVELRGELYAVVVDGRMTDLRRLGSIEEVDKELEALRFALRRLGRGHGTPASLAAAGQAASYAAGALDRLLIEPLSAQLEDRPLVVVPTGALHALPWSALPSLTGRPLTIAPCAAFWHQVPGSGAKQHRDRGPKRTVLVAGPALAHALPEVSELAARYPRARLLSDRQATVDNVIAAMDGADLAHVAAHGSFRADNPLFSFLELADGRLTVYDLQALKRAPRTLVLSACESGLSSVTPGDELMGLASALFALGTRSLVATVVPVPDAATRSFVLAVHAWLRAGLPPSVALARAQASTTGSGPRALAASVGFVCFGAE